MLYALLTALLFGLSFLAGMLELGVAFIATPVLGLFGFDLKHVIIPWSVWRNGLTALSGAITFARGDGGLAHRDPIPSYRDSGRADRRVAPAICADEHRVVDLCERHDGRCTGALNHLYGTARDYS